jgi:hypothetical protein
MLDDGFESDLAKHDGLLMREGWKDTEQAREAGSELNRGRRRLQDRSTLGMTIRECGRVRTRMSGLL